jgi:hypothetical protein
MAFPSDLVRTKNWGTEILTDTDLEGQLDLVIAWIMAALDSSSGHAHTGVANKSPKVNVGDGLTVTNQAQGDILYASLATAFARLAAGTKGKCLTTGGAAANPTWEGMTTQGDIEYHNGTTRTALAAGTSGLPLVTKGAAANPEFAALAAVGISAVLGTWDATNADNTSYLAATDGFVVAEVTTAGASANVIGYTDTANPPITERAKASVNLGTAGIATNSITMPVKKGHYWKTVGATKINWIPLGS